MNSPSRYESCLPRVEISSPHAALSLTAASSWSKGVQRKQQPVNKGGRSSPSKRHTQQHRGEEATMFPVSSPYLGFETTLNTPPLSNTPSPNTRPLPPPPGFPTSDPMYTFSERLMVKHASAPVEKFIDPFCVEVHMPCDCSVRDKRDLGEMMKIVLEEVHVLPDRDYFSNGSDVLCYIVYPYRLRLEQVQRQKLACDLAWRAQAWRKPKLASALARAGIDVFPHQAPTVPASAPTPPMLPSEYLPSPSMSCSRSCSPYLDVNDSMLEDSTGCPYMEAPAPQSPFVLERKTSNSSAYKNLVQPAVTHLVSKTKKKRTTGLPADFRARQNLVQLKHNKALSMLRPWLLDESEGKIYLRGDNVAFIQVKCPKALQAVDAFLERILNEESIEIVQCTSPLSRKRQGQLKGYLLYLKCRTAANVARINEIYEQDFADSGLKCKTARFEKKHQQQQEQPEQQRVSLEASSSESSTEESAL